MVHKIEVNAWTCSVESVTTTVQSIKFRLNLFDGNAILAHKRFEPVCPLQKNPPFCLVHVERAAEISGVELPVILSEQAAMSKISIMQKDTDIFGLLAKRIMGILKKPVGWRFAKGTHGKMTF
ncbi:hypothetical protein [Ferrovum myxofaciens]|uniref:hypothetical protein n=1 Tax=Ferrovum myxofaciens TaxID=416213 RepID=UPI003EC0A9BD